MRGGDCGAAGVGIQYLVPALLCYCGRKQVAAALGSRAVAQGSLHRSVFAHPGWIVLVCVWSVACVGFVTFNYIYEHAGHHHHH